MSKIIDYFKFGRNFFKIGLFSAINKDKHIVLYIGNSDKKILLKKFRGQFDYEKFLLESVLIRMMCDKKTVRKAHICYNNLASTYKDLTSTYKDLKKL